MQSHSDMVEHDGSFIETGTIEHDGHEYTSGGAFLAKRVDTGKYEGLLYAYERDREVGTWDSSLRIKATFANVWKNNKGDWRQNVYFIHEIDGEKKYFHGIYYRSSSDIVRVREVKPWEKPAKKHDFIAYFYNDTGETMDSVYLDGVTIHEMRNIAWSIQNQNRYATYAFLEQ